MPKIEGEFHELCVRLVEGTLAKNAAPAQAKPLRAC